MKPFHLGFPHTALRRQLVAAVLRGDKKATAGLWEGSSPAVGERLVLQDDDDEPVGVVEVTEARVVTAGEIDEQFARDEGEGFESVADWRHAHEQFFGRPLRDDEPIVAVRFRLTDLIVAERYRGPARSGNGGYTAGLVASLLGGSDVEVTLRVPPPLDTPLRIDGASVYDGETLVAEAKRTGVELELPAPPPSVESGVPDPEHPFPTCFVCGPGRADGLGLRPRRYDSVVAAPWRPDVVTAERVWAALDCPGAFGVDPDLSRGASVLGRLAVHLEQLPAADEELVVVGWDLGGADGRRSYAGTCLFRGTKPLAWGRATWFAVPSGA